MAAPIIVPGTLQAVIDGTIGSRPYANITHWATPTYQPWTQAQLQDFCNSFMGALQTYYRAYIGYITTINDVRVVDLSDNAGRVATSGAAPFAGGDTGAQMTSNDSFLINFHIASRYRGGHPRIYLPPPAAARAASSSTWDPSWANTALTGFTTVVNTMHGGVLSGGLQGINHVVPRYLYTYTNDNVHHKWLRQKSSLQATYVVQNYSEHLAIASQRRRI